MNLDNRMSWANVITIGILLFSIAVSFGMMNTNITTLNSRIDQKADENVVEVKFQFIQEDLSEINAMITSMQKDINGMK